VHEFDVGGLMFGWELFEMASKGWNVDFVPLLVGPFVFGLKVVSKVCAVELETAWFC
jgi:hypothetical protein